MSACPVHGVQGPWCTFECVELAHDLRRGHVCEDEAVEYGSEPDPRGTVALTKRCGVCGRTIARGTDRILWDY